MNKGLVIGIVVALLVVGAGAYFFTRNTSDTSNTNNQNINRTQLEEPGEAQPNGSRFSGTFLDLLALGQNYTCDFDTTDDMGNTTTGKVYMAAGGERMNGEFMVQQSDGSTFDGNVIRDGEYNYIWTSMDERGYKMKITPEDEALFGADTQTDESTGLSDTDEVDFDCRPWVVDSAMFVPPSNIEFMDLSEVMNQVQEFQGNMQDSLDCSMCDQVPEGAARDQCLQSLNC